MRIKRGACIAAQPCALSSIVGQPLDECRKRSFITNGKRSTAVISLDQTGDLAAHITDEDDRALRGSNPVELARNDQAFQFWFEGHHVRICDAETEPQVF